MLATFKDIYGETKFIYQRVAKVVEGVEPVLNVMANNKTGEDSVLSTVGYLTENCKQEKFSLGREKISSATKEELNVDDGGIRSNPIKGEKQVLRSGDSNMLSDEKTLCEVIRSMYSMVRAGPTLKDNWRRGNYMVNT